MKHTVNLYRI